MREERGKAMADRQTTRQGTRRTPPPRRGARRFMSSTACALALAAVAHPAHAGPQGGVVVGGSASINQAGSVTDINQSTQRAIIDWRGFDVGASETVNFRQPSASSVTLNRVTAGGASDIRGTITAPGNVWLVNPNGVVIGNTARIDVGGFIATTADIDNDAFMAGQDRFDRPGSPDAAIVNRGQITFGEAGLVGLVGPQARNEGVIVGSLGRVVIAGADAFAVDMAGDGILALPTGEATHLAAVNTGSIRNDGGLVLIDAATAEGVLESTVSAGGVIEARTVASAGGRVVLSGGDMVEISGQIDATGGTGLVGGEITATGDRIRVTGTARIDASGDAGGGDIRIGGDVQGGGDLRQARVTVVEDGAEIRADAITAGDGGTAVIWSENATGFFGALSVRGGGESGDGGFAEVSGGYLKIEGSVDLAAPNGAAGELLLDPQVILVSASGTIAEGAPGFDILFDDPGLDLDGQTTTITPDFITSVNGTLTLQATDFVTIIDDVDNTATGNTLALTLEAGRGIQVGAALNIDGSITMDSAATEPSTSGSIDGIRVGGVFTLNGSYYYADGGSVAATGAITMTTGAGQDVVVRGGYSGNGFISAGGLLDFNIGTDGVLSLGYGATLSSGAGLEMPQTVLYGFATLNVSGGDVTQADGTAIVEGYGEGVYSSTLVVNAGSNDILLGSSGNNFSEFRATGGNILLRHTNSVPQQYYGYGSYYAGLTIRGLSASGNVEIVTDGSLAFADVDFSVSGDRDVDVLGNATFDAGGDITAGYDASIAVAGDTTFRAADDQGDADPFNDTFADVLLRNDDNSFGGVLRIVGGTVEVMAGSSLTVEDSYAQTEFEVESRNGDLTVSRLFVGAFDAGASGPGGVAVGGPGTATLLAGEGSVTATDIFADDLLIGGPRAEVGFSEVGGDVTLDRFDARLLTVYGTVAGGSIALSNGSTDTLTLSGGYSYATYSVLPFSTDNLSLTSVDIIGADPLTIAEGSIREGGTLTLNGVRSSDLTADVPNLALGFVEMVGFTVNVPGDITKLPNSALDAGRGGTLTITAPSLPADGGGAGILADREVNTGDPFTYLARIRFAEMNLDLASAGNILLTSGITSDGVVHNDFERSPLIGAVETLALEDANDLFVITDYNGLSDGPVGDVLLRANSDGVGEDGKLNLFLSYNSTFNTATLIGDGIFIDSFDYGQLGTIQMVGSYANLQMQGAVDIRNSRLSEYLFVRRNSGGYEGISITDSSIGSYALLRMSALQQAAFQPQAAFAPLALPAGDNIELTRVAIGGDLIIQGTENIGLTDVQVGGDGDLRARNIFLERTAFAGGLDTRTQGALGPLELLQMLDTSIGGDLDANALDIIAADRLRVGGAATLEADTSIELVNFVIDGPASLTAPQVTLTSGDFGAGLTLADGTQLAMTDISLTGDLDTGLTTSLAMSRVLVVGALTASSTGGLAIDNLSTTAGASFAGTSYDLAFIDINGAASFADGGGITLSDAVFRGPLDLGTQGAISGQRLFVGGALTGASGGSISLSDLQAGATTLSAGDSLALTRFAVGDATLGANGFLSLSDGRAGVLTTGTSAPSDLSISNLGATSVDVQASGDVALAGVQTTGLLGATSLGGDIFFAELSAGTLDLVALEGGIFPFSGPGLADFTILGAGALTLPGPIAALADIEGPGAGQSVVIGTDLSSLLGDAPGTSITAVVDPVEGKTGDPALPALGERPALPDVTFFAQGCTLATVETCTPTEILVLIGPIIGDIMGNDVLDDEVRLVLPYFALEKPLFDLPAIDFATLFSATGNENLWQRGARGAEEEVTQ